jgi:hypothetical protein
MKKLMLMLTLGLAAASAQANDGGIAAIKVNEIKMREAQINAKTGKEEVVRRIVNPNFTILIEGGEAEKLQKILPSEISVLTAMQPEIAAAFNASFKTLGIYSDKTAGASGKVITISCSDAELNYQEKTQKYKIQKKGKSTCKITIQGVPEGADIGNQLGDIQEFNPSSCR